MGYSAQPASWPAPDLYERDRSYWGRLEPTRGAYDFSPLDAGLADVGAVKGKFGFRVMAYCPGCWMESRPDLPSVVPSWMPLQPGTDIPDWNDESFLTAWEDLMGALGARYDADPRLGYVDVGGFGAYGEWADAGERVTDANALRMIDAVASAFPHHHVLMSAVAVYTQPTVLRRAVDRWANLGLRSDCLGQPAMQVPEAGFDTLWTTRPFVTEWCTGADPATGRDQVRAHHVSTTSSHNMRLTYDQMSAAQKAAYEEAVRSAGYRYAVTRATVSSVSPGQPFQVDLAVANTGSAPTYDPWDGPARPHRRLRHPGRRPSARHRPADRPARDAHVHPHPDRPRRRLRHLPGLGRGPRRHRLLGADAAREHLARARRLLPARHRRGRRTDRLVVAP